MTLFTFVLEPPFVHAPQAYPSFNVNEILSIADLYEGSARASGTPIVVFNGASWWLLLLRA